MWRAHRNQDSEEIWRCCQKYELLAEYCDEANRELTREQDLRLHLRELSQQQLDNDYAEAESTGASEAKADGMMQWAKAWRMSSPILVVGGITGDDGCILSNSEDAVQALVEHWRPAFSCNDATWDQEAANEITSIQQPEQLFEDEVLSFLMFLKRLL